MATSDASPELEIVPSPGLSTENCVVVTEGTVPDILDIVGAAAKNSALVDNSGEEAGDDQFAVQFPGHHPQELLEQDQVHGRIRELIGAGGE